MACPYKTLSWPRYRWWRCFPGSPLPASSSECRACNSNPWPHDHQHHARLSWPIEAHLMLPNTSPFPSAIPADSVAAHDASTLAAAAARSMAPPGSASGSATRKRSDVVRDGDNDYASLSLAAVEALVRLTRLTGQSRIQQHNQVQGGRAIRVVLALLGAQPRHCPCPGCS